MGQVRLERLKKSYGSVEILHDIELSVEKGEFVVLLGPSGCGKSTTLRAIAGLEKVTSGKIDIDGRDVTNLEPRERDIAMVFQNYALYPTMTVAQNISFGLKAKKVPSEIIENKVQDVAALLNLSHLLERKPGQLSGGQQQRVAIGRAIVRAPKVFLFDEPLSNLDANLRIDMRLEIMRLHKALGATTIFVTHDQEEAMTMADRIVIMKEGRIEQIGTPEDIYFRPRTLMVAKFIGSPSMNFIKGKILGPNRITTLLGELSVKTELPEGTFVEVGVRPDDISPTNSYEAKPQVSISMVVNLVELLGPRAVISLSHQSGQKLTAVVNYSELSRFKLGSLTKVALPTNLMHVFQLKVSDHS